MEARNKMTTLQKAGNRKLVIVIAQAMLLLMSAYIAYSIYEQNEQEKQREQLQLAISEITDLYRSGQTSTIDLSKMDLFPWDKLHVFGPTLLSQQFRES
jgi:flagellar basal body-associated protein FliL